MPSDTFAEYGRDRISAQQKASLARVGIVFNSYFREASLYETGKVWETLAALRDREYIYEQDGAQWFRSTAFGDEKDRVVVKAGGEPTYRLPDMAYHYDKAVRGFDLVIDIFGPDHHATAPQVLMGVRALGYSSDFVHTLLHQIVTLVRGGETVKMSTRRGQYVTLDELVDEVGADAIRYFMISRSANSPIDFDLNLAREQSDNNPVYYIQNAHVRCAGIFRKWASCASRWNWATCWRRWPRSMSRTVWPSMPATWRRCFTRPMRSAACSIATCPSRCGWHGCASIARPRPFSLACSS